MDRQLKKKKWPLRKIIWFSLAGAFVIIVTYSLLFGDHSSKYRVNLERITISEVYEGPFQEFIPVTGAVIPIKTIYLDAIEGGRVDTVYLEAGSFVNKDDNILKLANTNLLLDIMYREAELFEQSNNLRNTRLAMEQHRLSLRAQLVELNYRIKNQNRVYKTATELKKKNLVSEQEFEEARDLFEYLMLLKQMHKELQKHQL